MALIAKLELARVAKGINSATKDLRDKTIVLNERLDDVHVQGEHVHQWGHELVSLSSPRRYVKIYGSSSSYSITLEAAVLTAKRITDFTDNP